MRWRIGGSSPRTMYSCESGAVVSGNLVYFNPCGSKKIYEYNHARTVWSQLPDCPQIGCSLAVINSSLTAIGGGHHPTNNLFSFTSNSLSVYMTTESWTEIFPPMPTKRQCTISVCIGTSLIVAGGLGERVTSLTTVEVLNTKTDQWFSVTDLPHPVTSASAAVCGDRVYVVERNHQSVYTCSLSKLLNSGLESRSRYLKDKLPLSIISQANVWKQVADVPLLNTTCVSLRDELLVVGGVDSELLNTASRVVHIYDSTTDSWRVISHMSTPRSSCFAAVLPGDQLIVVGGIIPGQPPSDSVEFATFI